MLLSLSNKRVMMSEAQQICKLSGTNTAGITSREIRVPSAGNCRLEPVAAVSNPPASPSDGNSRRDSPPQGQCQIRDQPNHRKGDPEYFALHNSILAPPQLSARRRFLTRKRNVHAVSLNGAAALRVRAHLVAGKKSLASQNRLHRLGQNVFFARFTDVAVRARFGHILQELR